MTTKILNNRNSLNGDYAYYGTFSKLGYGFIAFTDKSTTVSILTKVSNYFKKTHNKIKKSKHNKKIKKQNIKNLNNFVLNLIKPMP